MALGRILGIFKSFFVGGIALFKSGFGKISFNVQYFMLAIREFIEKTYTRLTTATGNAFNQCSIGRGQSLAQCGLSSVQFLAQSIIFM